MGGEWFEWMVDYLLLVERVEIDRAREDAWNKMWENYE